MCVKTYQILHVKDVEFITHKLYRDEDFLNSSR